MFPDVPQGEAGKNCFLIGQRFILYLGFRPSLNNTPQHSPNLLFWLAPSLLWVQKLKPLIVRRHGVQKLWTSSFGNFALKNWCPVSPLGHTSYRPWPFKPRPVLPFFNRFQLDSVLTDVAELSSLWFMSQRCMFFWDCPMYRSRKSPQNHSKSQMELMMPTQQEKKQNNWSSTQWS